LSSFQANVVPDSVLVVDDDQSTRDSLASVLKGAGMEVFVAADQTEALTLHSLQRPAAVVVDHQLADHTGVELAQRLKEEDPETPVLLLTGLASLDSALAVASQLDGLLVKPLVPQAFVQTVRSALTQRALVLENQRLNERVDQLNAEAVVAPPPAPAPVVAPAPVAPAPTVAEPPAEEPPAEPPNRALLESQLETALAASRRDNTAVAVMYVELDGWQEINDQSGPHLAERVFREVVHRLAATRRRSDVITRVASDKFAVICSDVATAPDAFRVSSLILDSVARPVVMEGREHWLRATVGIMLTDPSSPPGETADNVLENAELAMYWARDEGRASRLFDPSMRDRVVSRYEVEHGLQTAMDDGELTLFYQPIVDLNSGQVVGSEALLRWKRPDQGVVLPGEFLDVAAEVGMTDALSRWTIDRALGEFAQWRAAVALPDNFRLTLNVSAREIADQRFVETFQELTDKHGIPPSMISIDLSEEAAGQAATADGTVVRLSSMGVLFNLDDFGAAGYRLSWLQELPVTSIKIAPQFVSALDAVNDARGPEMVRALIALGHDLHLSVIAEGVETPTQAAALRAIGCEFAQGYHFGHPEPRQQVWAVPET
jgi:diguanylate cyclase (GGDEF)-like protein